jgi:hypothetical protein
MAERIFGLPSLKDFIREHLVWVLGLLPFAFAAIQMLVVTGGEPEVAAYLVQNVGVVSIVFCIILPLIPLAALLTIIWFVNLRFATPKSERIKMNSVFSYAIAVVIVISLVTIPLGYLGIVAVTLLATIIQSFNRWSTSRRDRLRYGVDVPVKPVFEPALSVVIIPLSIFATMAVMLPNSGSWSPYENFRIKNLPETSGILFVSDHTWTIFRDEYNHVHIVKTDDVISREPCQNAIHFFTESLNQIILTHRKHIRGIECVNSQLI